MPRFWGARLELVTLKKRKEEQAKRDTEKQNRIKKKKQPKSSSTSGEEPENTHDGKTELEKQQENIFNKRQDYAHRSSSSESEVPTSPGFALPHEMRKNELFKSHERLDDKRSPPPVLPKPKPKPKLPPANKSPASPTNQPMNNHAMHEIANEISQIKLHNNKRLVKGSSSDSENEVKLPKPKIPKKPLQQSKSLDFNMLQTSDNRTDNKTSLPRQNAVYFEDISDSVQYSKMDNRNDSASTESPQEETNSTPKEVFQNLEEKGANLMTNKKRMLTNCWPLGCQDDSTQDEDPLYSTVNFAALGYTRDNDGVSIDQYRESTQMNTHECTPKSYPNSTYSPPTPSSPSPQKADHSDVIHISKDLGIKEVQSIVQGTSYTVGDNRDLYSLPIKTRTSSNNSDTESPPTPRKGTAGKRTSEVNTHGDNIPDDMYSQPIVNSPRKMQNFESDTNTEENSEGPYAETALFDQTPLRSNSQYDIPGLLIDTSRTTFDLKPPNFKPPPPPPGGSPILKKKTKNKLSPQFLRHKIKSPRKTIKKLASEPSKDKDFEFNMKRSQSASDLTSEPIFATPSSIGITSEDNNNNSRHSMFVTPKEVGTLREYFVYSDDYKNAVNAHSPVPDGKLRQQVGNGRKHVRNHRDHIGNYEEQNSFPVIVPPPPSSTPIIDTDSMVAPPPPRISDNTPSGVVPRPPMYPPPRLHPSERAFPDVNCHNEESEWREMIERLPPPSPELLES